jgi:hypothetical protein
MIWTRHTKKALREALQSTYRGEGELSRFLGEEFDLRLSEISSPGTLVDRCYEVIDYCEAKSLLDKLYREFCRENSNSSLPQTIADYQFVESLGLDSLNPKRQSDSEILCALNGVLQEFNLDRAAGELHDRLMQLASDCIEKLDWGEEGNVAYLATRLYAHRQLPAPWRDRCRDYLARQGYDCNRLVRKLPAEYAQPDAPLRHILVKIVTEQQTLHDTTEVEAWIYTVSDNYSFAQLGNPVYYDNIQFGDLPEAIWKVRCDRLPRGVYPTVHYFLSHLWFDLEFNNPTLSRRKTFGSEHCIVLRTDTAQHPELSETILRSHWKERWQNIHAQPDRPVCEVFQSACCRLEVDDLLDRLDDDRCDAFFLENCGDLDSQDYGSIGEFIHDAVTRDKIALPALLWSRCPDVTPALDSIFDASVPIADVPEYLRQLRRRRDPDAIGQHLALVWEDPDIPMPEPDLLSNDAL